MTASVNVFVRHRGAPGPKKWKDILPSLAGYSGKCTNAPTASIPAKAGQLRKSTVERLLKQHRIRRVDAGDGSRTLREPAIKVAEGVAEAASIHMRLLVARLGIVNREMRQADELDVLCTALGESAASGVIVHNDRTSRSSSPCPGSAGSTSLLCSPKVPGLSAAAIIKG